MRHARGERGMIGLAAAVASVVIVAVIGGALLVHAYSDTVRNLTRKDSIGYLADISSQITENVARSPLRYSRRWKPSNAVR